MIFHKLLMNLILVIRKLSFTRISGPHEAILDLLEKRLGQSSQSTLLLRPAISKAQSCNHQKRVAVSDQIINVYFF